MIILGGANLIADGFGMAVSNFLGSRAERQQRERARREEATHIRLVPEGEREELGYGAPEPNELRAALTTFVAFVTVGFLPLLVYVYDLIVDADVEDPFL